MAEIITKAYLINRKDYELFDEIITFINEYGNIFTVLALGVKKILSKNSRNLFYGCLSEFEFFSSRDIDNKIGKLKKVLILENNIDISNRFPLILLNKAIYVCKLKGTNVFEYLSYIVLLLKNVEEKFDNKIVLKILAKLTSFLGIKPILNRCSCCSSKDIYTFSFVNNGFVCKNHFDIKNDTKYDNEIIKIIYLSFYGNKFIDKEFNEFYIKVVSRIYIDYILDKSGVNLYFITNEI